MILTADDLISARDAWSRLGVSRWTFYQWDKRLNFERQGAVGRAVQYSWADILGKIEWVKSHEKAVASASCPGWQFFDQRQAASRLGIAVNTFRSAAARERLTRHRVGSSGVRYRWGEITCKLTHAVN